MMSVSTDAILFYGYCWNEECKIWEDDDDREWQESVLVKRGYKDPWDTYPSNGKNVPQWRKDNDAAFDAWIKLKSDVNKEFGCDLGYHCSDDCSMPFVFINDSKIAAGSGYPEEIALNQLEIEPNWNEKLDRFLEELGIEKPDGQVGPKWWLVSYWG